MGLKEEMRAFEYEKIVMALSVSTSIANAAKLLGENRTTLCMQIKKHGIRLKKKNELLVINTDPEVIAIDPMNGSKE